MSNHTYKEVQHTMKSLTRNGIILMMALALLGAVVGYSVYTLVSAQPFILCGSNDPEFEGAVPLMIQAQAMTSLPSAPTLLTLTVTMETIRCSTERFRLKAPVLTLMMRLLLILQSP
jgi:hypothetical protein